MSSLRWERTYANECEIGFFLKTNELKTKIKVSIVVSACTADECFQIHGAAIAIDVTSAPFRCGNPFQNEIALLDQDDETADRHHGGIDGANEAQCNAKNRAIERFL